MQLFKKLKEYYKNFLLKKLSKKQQTAAFYKNSTTKHSMNSGATMKLSTETEKKVNEVTEILDNLMKEFISTPKELIKYMKKKGMEVHIIKKADKLLTKIGEQEGFLTPLKGTKAFTLNLMISINEKTRPKISFKTKEMFIFNDKEIEIYTLARALYKYYGFKKNLPGYDYKTQEIYKKIYKRNKISKTPLNGCSINDIYACKEALSRDMESINYSLQLSERYDGSKQALEKIKNENSANI